MFWKKKEETLRTQTPHRKIEVETIDSEDQYEFLSGGQEVAFAFVGENLEVRKSDGLLSVYPAMNVIRVEEFLE